MFSDLTSSLPPYYHQLIHESNAEDRNSTRMTLVSDDRNSTRVTLVPDDRNSTKMTLFPKDRDFTTGSRLIKEERIGPILVQLASKQHDNGS